MSCNTLYCFPSEGRDANDFQSWKGLLSAEIYMHLVKIPGHDCVQDKPAFRNLSDLVDFLVPQFLSAVKQPMYFFGHSMGALVAYELARTLYIKHSILISHVIVSGFRAPSLPNNRAELHQLEPKKLALHEAEVGQVNIEKLETLYSDLKLVESYQYQRKDPLPIKISVLWGQDDPFIQRKKIGLWQMESSQHVDLYPFEGDHFYLDQQAKVITEIINDIVSEEVSA